MKGNKNAKRKITFPTVSVEEAKALLEKETLSAYGKETSLRVLNGSAEKRTCFRVNTLKAMVEGVTGELAAVGLTPTPLPFYKEGFVLPAGSESALTKTACYEKGEIYLQNASSFLPPLVLGAKGREDVLDMCAAPGGKTGMIYALSGGTVNLTACEKNTARAEKLKSNIEKQGVRATVLLEDALALSPYLKFDRILLDAPCSGSGTLNFSDGKTCKTFSEGLISSVNATQKKLIQKAVSLLKKGGIMVYSTCSVLPRENDEVVQSVLKTGEVSVVPLPKELWEGLPVLPCMEGALTVCPTDIYEGFYVAVLKKEK
ncbi:MAG: RsmB/NOP family class I SAM-dependent RNA methyltransferase [Clostridiales bacterium]|nr:RsmB/NOP family class I SAM-dependent RNA methyltransferase [Clostridiales bacterium]